MKKRQKRSNLGQLVLTCTDHNDLRQQLQDDTELLGKMFSNLIDRRCNWRSPYDQEVITNVCTSILACITELAEHHYCFMRDNVVDKYDAWLELYRRENKN